MKLKPLLILLILSMTLSSCLPSSNPQVPTLPNNQSQTSGQPQKPDQPVWDPTLPLWTAEQAEAAAQEVLLTPTSGVVAISGEQKYSYEEMAEDLQTLAKIYSNHLSCYSIGKSVAGRELYVAVLGNPSAAKQVVVSAAIHAREYMTTQLVMKQLEFYLRYYNTGSYGGIPYSVLFENCCFYIVPMTNPDGVMLSQQGLESLPTEEMRQTVRDIYKRENPKDRTFTTYLSQWKANARGVDLNRNYDALWEAYDKASAPQSYQDKGPSHASEPETQAMVSLIDGLRNVVCVLCIHSQGEVLYWNCGQEKELADQTLDFTKVISERNQYKIDYEKNNDASLSDWCELERSIIAVTVETGNVACPLPFEQFDRIWLRNYDLLPLTANYFIVRG